MSQREESESKLHFSIVGQTSAYQTNMKTPSFILSSIVSIAIIISNVGCANQAPTLNHIPQETPTPMLAFQQLPQYGRIDCSFSHDVYLMAKYGLYEFPGLSPESCDSDCASELGEEKGLATPCTIVLVTDYSWSEWDDAYYLYVKYQEPIPVTICKGGSADTCNVAVEFQQSEGWIKADSVEFPYKKFTPTPNIPYPIRTPASMPKVPEAYLNLPKHGRILCDLNSLYVDDPQFPDLHARNTVQLWETPNPTIENGNFGDGYPTISKPKNVRKRVEFCTIVRVTKYAWSEWDNTFYFYVEYDEYKYGGWIKQEYVEFPYTGATPTRFPTHTPSP